MIASPGDGSGFLVVSGRPIAPGLACGPLRRNRTELGAADVAGCVLFAERAVPDDIGRILAAAGTLTLAGTVLSHVSLLSREFGKPSVSLAGVTPAKLAGEGETGLLCFPDVVGGGDAASLDEGDIVMIDGSRGTVTIPGGCDRQGREMARRLHGPLVAFGKLPSDETLTALVRALSSDRHKLAFLLEAAFPYRLVPAGDAARRLLSAIMAKFDVEEAVEALRERVLAEAAARCEATLADLSAADDLEELQRSLRQLETALDSDLKLLEDLGSDPDRLEQRLEPVLAAAGARRTHLEEALRQDVRDALVLSEELFRTRLGGLFRLLRRARAARLATSEVTSLHRRLAEELALERARAGTHLVVPLGAVHDRSLIGGKAHALADASHALSEGCRIPRGFVVTAAAYRLHLLGETGEKLRLAVEQDDPNAISRKARAALLSGDLPEEVRDAVKEAYDTLGAARLAVRSSATIEDGPFGSLAGLFDTYLGVSGFPDLLDRVRWAWASLWNARAVATLASTGMSLLRAGQAVIVQEMVETKSAGVLFSRDPAGRPDTLLVNAAWGLGEGISQGELAGDLFWVRRSNGDVLASESGRATRKIELAPSGMGTVDVPLPPELVDRPCLTAAELARVAGLARAVEEVTGRAQDVEFGFDHDGGLVVFQMRRIVPRRSA
jgi:pyruvate,water dikinase